MAMRAIPIFDVEAAVANIAVHRGAAETIDEGIFVEVTSVDGATIAGSEDTFVVYDPVLHRVGLNGGWTVIGPDGSTWSLPADHPDALKNRKQESGIFISYIPRVAGTYLFMFLSEDDTGFPISGSVSVTVKAPEVVFAPAQTIILYDGADLTGAPAHDVGNRFTDYSAAISAFHTALNTGPARLAILGGMEKGEELVGSDYRDRPEFWRT